MRKNKFRELLSAGKPTIGTRTISVWPELVEVIGHTGAFDYVEFVAEYGDYDLHDLENYARAVELFDMSCIIKPDQQNQGWVVQRAIGAGFQGVNFVDCRSADDARECVRIVRPETPADGGHQRLGPAALCADGLRRIAGLRPGDARCDRDDHDREEGRGREPGGDPVGSRR